MRKLGLTILLAISFMSSIHAVTAYPGVIKFKQPAGNFIQIHLFGDERFNWGETLDGYSLVHDETGAFVYATLDENGDMVPSEFVAAEINERTAEATAFLENTRKHLRYSDQQRHLYFQLWEAVNNSKNQMVNKSTDKATRPVTIGQSTFLAILVNFSDKSFINTNTNIEKLFNQVNYSTFRIKGSVHDYYYENSYGQMSVRFDVVGPYNLTRNIAYYGNTSGGSQAFAREAINLAVSNGVDFSRYDNNGDHIVDAIHILFAGYGEEDTGNQDCIWSHKGNLSIPISNNGVTALSYSCSPELREGGSLTNVGVICHELGHVFGAPDYYDTDNNGGSSGSNGYPGNGKWDIMSSGSWNGTVSGNQPAHHNPYTKCYIYKWATPKEITATAKSYVLNSVDSDSASFYKLNTTTNGEYFLLENRQAKGFDASLPGHGMLIYHVHAGFDPSSQLNNISHPQKFYPVCAGSSFQYPQSNITTYGAISGSACPFPGSMKKTSFTDNSTPWAKSWAKNNTGKPITNITENATTGTISFTANNAPIAVANAKAIADNTTTISVKWGQFGEYPTLVLYSANGTFGTPDTNSHPVGSTISGGGKVLFNGDGSSVAHTGLTAGQTCYYKLFVKIENQWVNGVVVSATTPTCTANSSFPYVQEFTSASLPTCWTKTSTHSNVSWTLGTGNGSGAPGSAHSGSYNAYCKITTEDLIGNQAYLITEPMDLSGLQEGAHLNFWFTNTKLAGCQDVLTVAYRSSYGEDWTPITDGTFSQNTSSWTEVNLNLDNISDYYQIAFISTVNKGKGICLDDITIRSGRISISAPTQNNPAIKLYPNPAKENVTFVINGNDSQTDFMIFDITGRLVSNGSMNGNEAKTVSLKDFKSGTYFVKFTNSDFNKTETLIIR